MCGYGRGLHVVHSGNKQFRLIIREHVTEYRHPCSTNRALKAVISLSVTERIVNKARMTFLKELEGDWIPLSEKEVRLKIGHALRDCRPTGGAQKQRTALQPLSDMPKSPRKRLQRWKRFKRTRMK